MVKGCCSFLLISHFSAVAELFDLCCRVRQRESWSRAAAWLPPDLALQCSNTLFFISVFAKNFRVNAVMKTSVLLSWEVPDSYKSAVPFKVRVGCRRQGALPGAVSRTVESSILTCHMIFSGHQTRPAEQGHFLTGLGSCGAQISQPRLDSPSCF